MYIKEIKDMINLMNENGLSELDVEKDGLRIKLRKGAGGAYEKAVEYVAQPASGTAAKEAAPKAEAKLEKKGTIEIKAPMVGTFYRAP